MTETIDAVIAGLGLTMQSEFVPLSQATPLPEPSSSGLRSASGKLLSLNWQVTILKNGRPILITDYHAGVGHCPSYRQESHTVHDLERLRKECETGKAVNDNMRPLGTISPLFADVLSSIVFDSEAIDYPTFEAWAESTDVDSDSRKWERVYRQCLEHALALRSAIGEDGLKQLTEAFRDY